MKLKEKFNKKDGQNKKEKKPLKQRIKESMNGKYLKNGSYSVVISAIFIVIVIVINMIVGSLPSKYTEFDVSSQKLYSIGDETKAYLKKLDKDITIYQVVQSGSEDETLKRLLEKYAEESSHIKVETKDPVVNPKFTSQYTSDDVSANSLIVVCGDRSKVVSYDTIYQSSMDYNTYSYTTTGFDGEGQIDSAISYVTSENLPILYTLDGHGEKELDSTLKEDIEKANIDIQSLNLLTEESVPDDAACLLINAPTTDGIRKRREKSPKAFVINKIKAISNRYRYSCIFIPPTMLLEFQTPFVEVANLHHETPTDMPSIVSAFSFHDIHI